MVFHVTQRSSLCNEDISKAMQSTTAELLSLEATVLLRTKLFLSTNFGNQKSFDKSL